MVSGNNGILKRAVDAKNANEKGIENDKINLAKQEALIDGYSTPTGMSLANLNTALGTSLESNQYNGNVSKVVDGVPIPTGFAYVEGTKKDEGLIVVDKYGNEFVWVPIVDGAETSNSDVWSAPGSIEADEEQIGTSAETLLANEFNKMKTSVALYGGFYVGRYETSWTGSQVASVGNAVPMNLYTNINGNLSNWYTFYKESKKLHNDSVVSSMIYNSQWNSIMIWMDDVINPYVEGNQKYVENSTGMGNYKKDSEHPANTGSGEVVNTGSNDKYKVKNIYDLAGNVMEWTQKLWEGEDQRTFRAGASHFNGSEGVSYANAENPSNGIGYLGTRLSLYIK